MWCGTRRKRSISLASTATYCWSPLALEIKTPTPLSVQALQEKESKQERSYFISSCCFTCTTQLQAPVEMYAAPQKYHFQVERHTFPWLQVGSAPLLYFVFRGQIYSAHNLNILERWSHLTSVCSYALFSTKPCSFSAVSATSHGLWERDLLPLKRVDDLHNKLKRSHWKPVLY